MSDTLRQFINEVFSTQQRHHFGPDPDDFRTTPGGAIDMNALREAGFVNAGVGASRQTFFIPDIDDKVLKIAYGNNSRRFNKYEANNQLQTAFPEFIPRVYAAADDYEWIISERVNVISSDAQFNTVLLKMFPAITDAIRGQFKHRITPRAILIAMLRRPGISEYSDEVFKQVMHENPDAAKSVARQMTRLIAMVHQFNIDPAEIRVDNVGTRYGQQDSFVLLDASIFSDKLGI